MLRREDGRGEGVALQWSATNSGLIGSSNKCKVNAPNKGHGADIKHPKCWGHEFEVDNTS